MFINTITICIGVVHILRNQPRGGAGGVSKCLRLITGGGGGFGR